MICLARRKGGGTIDGVVAVIRPNDSPIFSIKSIIIGVISWGGEYVCGRGVILCVGLGIRGEILGQATATCH